MMRFVQSEVRRQGILLPEYLDDYVAEDNPVRVIDVLCPPEGQDRRAQGADAGVQSHGS